MQNAPGRLDTVEARHVDVHQDHIRLEAGRQRHRFFTRRGFIYFDTF
jgi:hypothetical protein